MRSTHMHGFAFAFAFALAFAFAAIAGCSRAATERLQPAPATEAQANAPAHAPATSSARAEASDGGRDAGPAHAPAPRTPRASPFAIAARVGVPGGIGGGSLSDYAGSPLPHVERLPNGGVLVAYGYEVARADGPGPLTIRTFAGGREWHYLGPELDRSGATDGFRWISAASPDATYDVHETAYERAGARLDLERLAAGVWQKTRAGVGWRDPVTRAGTVLAIEETVVKHPAEGFGGDSWLPERAHVVVVAGPGPAPVAPPKLCPNALATALDGALFVSGTLCNTSDAGARVARYPAGAAKAASVDALPGTVCADAIVAATSATEAWAGCEDELFAFANGAWTSEKPFGEDARIRALSVAPDGKLWVGLAGDDAGRTPPRLVERARGGSWVDVPLPYPPDDALDPEAFGDPMYSMNAIYRVKRDPAEREEYVPVHIDATGPEVFVLGVTRAEAALLSTAVRAPAARVGSLTAQRANLARAAKRKVAAREAECPDRVGFLAFPEGTKRDALATAVQDKAAAVEVVNATVEGKPRVVGLTHTGETDAALKELAAFAPKLLCGVAIVEDVFDMTSAPAKTP